MADSTQLRELFEPIQADLKRFERLEAKVLRKESPLIQSISRHLLQSRGKRLRPAFTFLVSKATEIKPKRLVEAALAIEMIHTATLLHDDVVDESETRRGQKTVNALWTNQISVLMGDYFFAKAFTLLVKTGSLEVLKRVSEATERVSVGELNQIEQQFNFELAEEEYMSIISDKTASLFRTSALSPALLHDEPRDIVNRLANFGEYTGRAFQIADDLLDLVGEEKRTGKKPGNDLMQGKITLPLIYSFRKSSARTRNSIVKLLENGMAAEGIERVLDFLDSNGGIEYARKKAHSLADKALSFVKPFSDNKYYDSLERLANFAIDRDR